MKKLIALVLLGFGLISYGQNVHYGTIYTFDSQQAESLEEYIASTRILLQNGFRATAVNGAYYRFRIGSDPTFVSPADYIQANDPNDRELDFSLPVGTVSGQASVSPNGSAIYDIPILVPPGTNGVQPSISVSYNSQSINGLLGKGWNLNATSSISRVGQVSYIDDKITAVNCSFDDRYALDGQRLVLSSGSEGQTNCAYRTEIESFSDIIVTDIQGNGPKSFIVKTKDGQILEYGGTEDSRLLGDGSTDNTVLVWYLNKMTDQNGNFIIYKYRNANGECVLDQIQYTGNANENLLPYNVIKFNYSEREDAGYVYFGGEKLNNTLILESIEIKCDFVTKLTYIFEYSNNGFASMLQEIILNDENGIHYNSVLVDWENASGFTFNTQETEINEIEAFDYDLIPGNTNVEPNSPTIRWCGDFNGDGLTDVLEYKEDKFLYTIHHVDGTYEDHEIHGSAFRILINNNQGDFIQSEIYFGYDIDEVSDVSIADIDNDGDDDFFARNDNDEDHGYYMTNNFQAFSFNNNQISELPNYYFSIIQTYSSYSQIGNTQLVIGDFNGDNNNEYFCLNGNNAIFRVVGLPISGITTLCDYPVYTFELINFNGNNKLDILVSNEIGHLKVFEYDEISNSFVQISTLSNMYIEDYPTNVNIPSDFNGDGLTDILSYVNFSWHMFISNGSNFIDIGEPYAINSFSHNLRGAISGVQTNTFLPGDFNGDGLTDFAHLLTHSSTTNGNSNDNIYIAYNMGNNVFFDRYLIKQEIISFDIITRALKTTGWPVNTTDFDGDGKTDICAHVVNAMIHEPAKIAVISFNDPSDQVLVEGMIDGLNHKTSFSYEKTAGNPVFYSKTMVNSPTTKVITPVTRLVSKLSTDAEPAPFETEYTYSDLLLNTQGKGMLGFAGLQSTDLNSGMRMTTRMSIVPVAEFPYISEQKVFLTHFNTDESDDELRMTNLTEITPSVSSAYGFYPITTSSVSIDHDLRTIIETVVDPAELDMYGNVLKSTSKVYNMTSVIDQTERSLNNLVQTKVTEISYNYSFETSKHLLGLPASTTETVTKTGSPAITSKMNFLYHPDGNIWKTIQNPSMFMSNKSVVTEMLGYNGCGMPTIKQVSAPNDPLQPPVRTESWEYDSKKRFVIAKTDAEGHTAYFSYNKVFGSVTKAVDIQGNVVTSEYDNFGNLLKSTNYLGLTTQYITEWNQNSSIDALYYSKVIGPNSPQSQSWFDENGRVVLSKTEGLNGDVYSEKEYNAHGQVESESLPHFSNEAPRYIEYSYYDDGRLQTKTYESLSTHYTYDGRITTVTKPDGKTETSEVNALGLAFKNSDELGTVFYTYNSAGQVTNIQSGQSNTQFEYDPIYNWRTKTISPDLGEINFVYYATGELYRQTDALGNQLEYSYDVLGRVNETKKFHAETNTTETITYSYNSTGNGVGQIDNVISTSGITQNYSYDQYGRLLSSQENIQGKSYSSSVEYNDNGQVTSQTYPYGYEVENEYNPKGFLTKIKQASDGQMIWQVVSENALGQRTQSLMGNGASLNLTYDPVYNTLSTVKYSMQNNAIWHQQYSFNAANGNLNWRSDLIRGMTEDFTYGLGDRLELVEINNGLQLNMKTVSYETNGNIAEKSDVGTYNYTGAQPHAVTEVYPYTGNEVLANQEVHYNATNKASTIEQDGMISTLTYGPDDQRRKMVFATGTGTTITRYYQSGFEEDEYSDGRNKKTYYISTPDGLTAMRIVSTTTGQTDAYLYYVASDYLGSICGLMDEVGSMQQEFSYDAWGARRDPATWQNYTQTQLTTYHSSLITDRGYTGHEMLDLYGLINMNGRMYDPLVGRFLSADPVIQPAGGSQGYNAYSYALNNPLKYTDPSGYLVSGGYYAPDMNGENRRLQFENNSYYDHMYNRGDFSSKGGFGGLNASVWAGGYQYQVSSSGTLISTNQNMNGLQLDTRNGNYGFWAESFSVENTQVPDGLQLADGSITLRTAVKKNVFVPLLGLSKLLNDNPFSSHVMRQGWENNNGNKMRERNMIRHTPQPQLRITGPDMQGVSISLNTVYGAGPGINITIGNVYDDGWFINVTNTFSAGADVSFSISRIEGYYTGDNKPTTKSLSGGYFYAEGSALLFTGGGWADITNNKIGQNWHGKYYGLSVGVTPISGATGIGITSDPYWFW